MRRSDLFPDRGRQKTVIRSASARTPCIECPSDACKRVSLIEAHDDEHAFDIFANCNEART
jgi:hypothetical protein